MFQAHLFNFRHVAHAGDDVVLAVHLKARRRQQSRHDLLGFVAQRDRPTCHAAARAHFLNDGGAVVQVDPDAHLEGRAAQQFFAAVAGQAQEAVVDQGVAAGAHFGERDAVGAGGKQVRQHGLGAAQRRLGGHARGGVVEDRQGGRAVGRVHPHAGNLHIQTAAIHSLQPEVGNRNALAHGQRFELLQTVLHVGESVARRGLVVTRINVQLGHVEARHRLAAGEAKHARRRAVGVEHDAAAVEQQGRR